MNGVDTRKFSHTPAGAASPMEMRDEDKWALLIPLINQNSRGDWWLGHVDVFWVVVLVELSHRASKVRYVKLQWAKIVWRSWWNSRPLSALHDLLECRCSSVYSTDCDITKPAITSFEHLIAICSVFGKHLFFVIKTFWSMVGWFPTTERSS